MHENFDHEKINFCNVLTGKMMFPVADGIKNSVKTTSSH